MWTEAIGITLAVVALWQTARANRFQKAVAESEGTFTKPAMQLTCWGAMQADLYLIAAPVGQGPLLIPLLLQAKNTGNATAEGLQLILRGHKNMLSFGDKALRKRSETGLSARVLGISGGMQSVFFELPPLHPGAAASVEVPALLWGATPQGRQSTEVSTADGHKLILEFSYHTSLRFDVALFQKDEAMTPLSCLLEIIDSSESDPELIIQSYVSRMLQCSVKANPLLGKYLSGKILRVCVIAATNSKRNEDGVSVVSDVHSLAVHNCQTRRTPSMSLGKAILNHIRPDAQPKRSSGRKPQKTRFRRSPS